MAEGKVREGNGGVDLAPNLRGEGHVVPPQEASASGGRRGGQEPLRLGRTAAAAAGRGQRGDAARESPPPRHASVAPEIGGGREGDELGEKVRDEREGGGGRSVWGPWNGGATPPHPTRGVEESYVDAPVLPRLVVECACTQRPKPTRGLLHMFFLLLLVYGIRPCLVSKKFCKIF